MIPFTRREFLATAAALAAQRAGAAVVPSESVAVRRAGLGSPDAARASFNKRARRPLPSPSQIVWQQDELALFVHFGINTFTDREWGDGRESPLLFAPSALDARQWARAARAAGFRAMVLTAKHHDGFCLWPTRTTTHAVTSSAWRNGEGDVVRLFVDACRAEGLRAGLYCSPWDRHEPSYGNSPRYNDLYCDQLTELLTWYGDIHEVWFDGANGEGPNGRRQEYDWPRFWALVRRLQPDAVMFSDAGPDIRWIGNEQGTAGDPNWSTVDPDTVPVPGLSGDAVIRQLQHGDANGTVWRPGECDVSIRPGWFHHAAEDGRVRDVDDLVRLYFASVGRNSKLLLNVPATAAGLLHDVDVARLDAMHSSLTRLFEERVASVELDIARPDAQRSVDVSLERALGDRDRRAAREHPQRTGRSALQTGWLRRCGLVRARARNDDRTPQAGSTGAGFTAAHPSDRRGCHRLARTGPAEPLRSRVAVVGKIRGKCMDSRRSPPECRLPIDFVEVPIRTD